MPFGDRHLLDFPINILNTFYTKLLLAICLFFCNLIKVSKHYTEYTSTVCYAHAHFINYLLGFTN